MPPPTKRAKITNTTPSRGNDDSASLQFARSIHALSASQKKFSDALGDLEHYKTEKLQEFAMLLSTKQSDLTDLDREYANKLKHLQIQTDQRFAEYQYIAAKDVLTEREEVPIREEALQLLEKGNESITQELSAQHEAEVERLKSDNVKSTHAAKQATDLSHKADIAELEARSSMYKHEIATLQTTINKLHQEVDAQRKLTEAVAVAGKSEQIQQTFGRQ
jgi:hypothetical protein